MISFASSYKSNFRIEVPLWHKVEEGVAPPGKDQHATTSLLMAQPVLPSSVPSPASCNDTLADVPVPPAQVAEEAEEEEAEGRRRPTQRAVWAASMSKSQSGC